MLKRVNNESENLPSFCLLIGYSGSIEYLQWSLHSVQTRRDKKDEAEISATVYLMGYLGGEPLSPSSLITLKSYDLLEEPNIGDGETQRNTLVFAFSLRLGGDQPSP
jgi:hypothetical protein